MVTKWYENTPAQEWMNNMTEEQEKAVERILEDQDLLNQAISYGLDAAGGFTPETAKAKREQILSNFDSRSSVAMFYVYQAHLVQSQISNQSPKQNHKETIMEQPEKKAERALTEKQVNYALNTRKPMFIKSAHELVNFLEQQNDPKWWLNRPQFNWAVQSFVKHQVEKYYEQNPDKRPQKDQSPVAEQSAPASSQSQASPQRTPPAQEHAEAESAGMKF